MRWQVEDSPSVASLRELMEANRISTVFHLAGSRGQSEASWAACAEANVVGTARLLNAAALTGVRRVVMMGSAAEYGAQVGPLHEEMQLQPITPYGASKAAATLLALAMRASLGLDVVVTRGFTVFGPFQPSYMFVASAIAAAVRDMPFSMSWGSHRVDLIYVEDAVRAILAAAECPSAAGLVINVGSGRDWTLREVAETIWNLAGCKAPLLLGDRIVATECRHDASAQIARARQILAWEPRVELREGIQRCLDWARSSASRQ